MKLKLEFDLVIQLHQDFIEVFWTSQIKDLVLYTHVESDS